MRLLFLTSRLPFPPIGGDKLRVHHFLKHLASRHQVTLYSFIEREEEESIAQREGAFLHQVRTFLLPRNRSLLQAAEGVFLLQDPLQVHYYRDPTMAQAVRREVSSGAFDLALAHMVRMAAYLLPDAGVKVVVDLQDALSLNYSRAAARPGVGWWSRVYPLEGPRIERYEAWVARKAEACLLVSEVDLQHVQRRTPEARLRLVRNGVDGEAFPFSEGGRDPDRILLLGNMRTAANQEMALTFAREIFPRVKQLHPAARFQIVGAEPTRKVRDLSDGENIRVTGEVREVLPHLHAASVSICPMRVGAGVQNKILESMAAGVPVVATPMGMEGIPAQHGVHALLAQEPEDFAQAVASLLGSGSPGSSLARAARALVEERFSWEETLKALDAVLEEVLPRDGGGGLTPG